MAILVSNLNFQGSDAAEIGSPWFEAIPAIMAGPINWEVWMVPKWIQMVNPLWLESWTGKAGPKFFQISWYEPLKVQHQREPPKSKSELKESKARNFGLLADGFHFFNLRDFWMTFSHYTSILAPKFCMDYLFSSNKIRVWQPQIWWFPTFAIIPQINCRKENVSDTNIHLTSCFLQVHGFVLLPWDPDFFLS